MSDKTKITIKNLNINKRPISAVADNYEVRNAKQYLLRLIKKLNLIFYMIQIEVFKKKLK